VSDETTWLRRLAARLRAERCGERGRRQPAKASGRFLHAFEHGVEQLGDGYARRAGVAAVSEPAGSAPTLRA
jgi:hypothetical protein